MYKVGKWYWINHLCSSTNTGGTDVLFDSHKTPPNEFITCNFSIDLHLGTMRKHLFLFSNSSIYLLLKLNNLYNFCFLIKHVCGYKKPGQQDGSKQYRLSKIHIIYYTSHCPCIRNTGSKNNRQNILQKMILLAKSRYSLLDECMNVSWGINHGV